MKIMDSTEGSGGFTLIESMMVLAILAVLLLIAVPGYQQFVHNNTMLAEQYSLRATLDLARTEALTRRSTVVVCPSADGSTCVATDNWLGGYTAFVDSNADNSLDPNNPREELIQRKSEPTSVNIRFSNSSNRVRFSPQGTAVGSEGTFVFCDDRGAGEAGALTLNPVGSVTSAKDTDTPEDGLVNDAGGNNVSC